MVCLLPPKLKLLSCGISKPREVDIGAYLWADLRVEVEDSGRFISNAQIVQRSNCFCLVCLISRMLINDLRPKSPLECLPVVFVDHMSVTPVVLELFWAHGVRRFPLHLGWLQPCHQKLGQEEDLASAWV